MANYQDIRKARIPLTHGAGEMPALGFGTLIPDPAVTITATRYALDAGFRHFDCAERYGNEREVGQALHEGLATAGISREDIFITTKVWNTNHRPERVERAVEASLDRLRLSYLNLYLIHTPFAFQPGDDQDPRDKDGNVLYDHDVTLLDTWKAMETLVDHGTCRAIGLSDITLEALKPIYESGRIKPAVVQVESHPYVPETELLEFCNEKGIVFLAFAPLGHGMKPGLLEDPVISTITAGRKNAGTSADSLGDTARHRSANHAQKCRPREGKFRRLAPSTRRFRRNQPNPDQTATESSGEQRRAWFHPTSQINCARQIGSRR